MKKATLSYEEISQICLELSLFLHAGADIGSGLVLLANEVEDSKMKNSLNSIAKLIDDGCTASSAFEISSLFPDDVIRMLETGEKTGRLEETFTHLAKYYESRHTQDESVRNALVYPSVLMLVMLSVIVILLTKVLPIFSDVYASHGGTLTGIAGSLLEFGTFLTSSLPFIAVVAVIFIILLAFFAFSESFREFLIFKKFKGINNSLTTARFAMALSMGISSGLTHEEAVRNASEMLVSTNAKKQSEVCLDMLSKGESLANAISATKLMPAAECRLLSIGFASGKGEEAMQKIALRLEKSAENEVERRIGFIEPCIVVITSLLVGLVLLAVMLPLTDIMSSIG